MLLVARLEGVSDPARLEVEARDAFAALAGRPGWIGGHLARAVDDPDCWVVVIEFADVGSGRRGLTAGAVRVAIMPLTSRFANLPATFEVVVRA